jgi:hypothetical protein
VGKEKDLVTGEVSVAVARGSAPRSGLHVTSRTWDHRTGYLGSPVVGFGRDS